MTSFKRVNKTLKVRLSLKIVISYLFLNLPALFMKISSLTECESEILLRGVKATEHVCVCEGNAQNFSAVKGGGCVGRRFATVDALKESERNSTASTLEISRGALIMAQNAGQVHYCK